MKERFTKKVERRVDSLSETEIEIPLPPAFMLTALDVVKGAPIHPLDRLKIMSAEEWEVFTLEVAHYLHSSYGTVRRCAGAGDKGRDVIAINSLGWVNYQCKHYSRSLSVTDVVKELGKLVYYTWRKEYTCPIEYYFVSPLGASVECLDALADSERIKKEVRDRWNKLCRAKITSREIIELTGSLLDYLNDFDFSIVKELPALKLVEYHYNTPFHYARFGSYMSRRSRVGSVPPEVVEERERTYIEALMQAFYDAEGKTYSPGDPLDDYYEEDMRDARIEFYSAEALEAFSRDPFPPGCFDDLKTQCYHAVRSVVRQQHAHGYERLLKTTQHASTIPYTSHPLAYDIIPTDKVGLCHHLVSDNKIKWVRS
ncbi:hypothetical protein D9M71_275500 [compost metagenome]